MMVGELIERVQEAKYLSVLLQQSYDGLVEPCQLLVWLIASRIVCRAAIKNISSAIARWIVRYSLLVREAPNSHDKRPFAIIL